MRTVIISTLVLGWGFWAASGGNDFVPASQETGGTALIGAAAADTATRNAGMSVLAELPRERVMKASFSGVAATGAAIPASDDMSLRARGATAAAADDGNIGNGSLKVISLTTPERATPSPAASTETTRVSAAGRDLRAVSGSRVNMRSGPGTGFGVVDQLDRGDLVEVLEVPGNGWVRLSVEESGVEGWMADFLLSTAG